MRGRAVFVIDHAGHIVAHPDTKNFVPGADVSGGDSSRIVEQVVGSAARICARTATIRYTEVHKNRNVEMIGTYSTFPELNWAVIARTQPEAGARRRRRERTEPPGAGVRHRRDGCGDSAWDISSLSASARRFAVSLHPHAPSAAANSISGRPVRGASEISELAENFNKMAGDIEEYIEKLKEAAEENRELFLGSIRMLAAAIDEKDPYTRGHSGRVAKYSTLIAQRARLIGSGEVDTLRISALLHDVGKIGVEDRVLKKPGALTPEEFALMKQHTIKGANIMRPVSQLKEMLPGIELHHEHMDGRGYPYGLTGAADSD